MFIGLATTQTNIFWLWQAENVFEPDKQNVLVTKCLWWWPNAQANLTSKIRNVCQTMSARLAGALFLWTQYNRTKESYTIDHTVCVTVHHTESFISIISVVFQKILTTNFSFVCHRQKEQVARKENLKILNINAATLLVLMFPDFAVFEKSSRKFVPAKKVTLENSVIFRQLEGFLQQFDGESAKIFTREIRSFLSPRK